jgi:hypothetical protein
MKRACRQTQTRMIRQLVDTCEFHPTLILKLFSDEKDLYIHL